jgi:hypothetical protein
VSSVVVDLPRRLESLVVDIQRKELDAVFTRALDGLAETLAMIRRASGGRVDRLACHMLQRGLAKWAGGIWNSHPHHSNVSIPNRAAAPGRGASSATGRLRRAEAATPRVPSAILSGQALWACLPAKVAHDTVGVQTPRQTRGL